MSSLPNRNVRKILASKSIEELATDYVVISATVGAPEGARPRLYGSTDLMGELKLRIGAHRAEKEIAKAREIYRLMTGPDFGA